MLDGKSPGESVAEAIKDPRIRILSLIESLKRADVRKNLRIALWYLAQSFEDSLEPYGWVNAVNLLMYDIRERRKIIPEFEGVLFGEGTNSSGHGVDRAMLKVDLMAVSETLFGSDFYQAVERILIEADPNQKKLKMFYDDFRASIVLTLERVKGQG